MCHRTWSSSFRGTLYSPSKSRNKAYRHAGAWTNYCEIYSGFCIAPGINHEPGNMILRRGMLFPVSRSIGGPVVLLPCAMRLQTWLSATRLLVVALSVYNDSQNLRVYCTHVAIRWLPSSTTITPSRAGWHVARMLCLSRLFKAEDARSQKWGTLTARL